MTGTGTQNDPYIVSTWEEFVAQIATSGAYVKIADNTVWDMNTIAPEGINQNTVLGIYCNLDGNGAIIKNLRGTGSTFLSVGNTTKNLYIEDFYYTTTSSGSKLVSTMSATTMIGVTLNGIVTGDSNTYAIQMGHQSMEVKRCSMNVIFDIGTDHTVMFQGNYRDSNGNRENCHFKFDLTNAKVYTSYPIGYNNSLIEIVRNSNDTGIYYNQAKSTIIRYDIGTEREVNQVYAASGTLTEVTDTQLKDAAYLASIGFPIGVD